ncbi:hypothetical protein CKF42_16195 [Pantoea sp. ARC270]|nr:hypothetical protein CKF42_16195 [Pantoea sp. ARC270]
MMKALTDIVPRKGQNTHILRSTITSHFMMKGSKSLVIQHIHGYANIRETMRYACFALSDLEEALSPCPIANQKDFYERP